MYIDREAAWSRMEWGETSVPSLFCINCPPFHLSVCLSAIFLFSQSLCSSSMYMHVAEWDGKGWDMNTSHQRGVGKAFVSSDRVC